MTPLHRTRSAYLLHKIQRIISLLRLCLKLNIFSMQHVGASTRYAQKSYGMSPSSSVSSRLAWKTIAVFCTVR
jgi:hypothetical protein